MRFAVESWSPDYGSPTGSEALEESTIAVDPWVEAAEPDWTPRAPAPSLEPLTRLAFVDGVRRVEANVWITAPDGSIHQGICASYGAGVVLADGSAQVVAAEVRRALCCPAEGAEPVVTRHGTFALLPTVGDDPDTLSLRLQKAMGELEGQVAASVAGERAARGLPPVDATIVDGPLKLGQREPGFVGFVKTHRQSYGPQLVRDVVAHLDCGERTPLLLVGDRDRYTWYHRLPCEVRHGWAGVVRLEIAGDGPVADAVALADRLTATLGRFASTETKDPRAPQNLVPIGGLERDLRRRLGDPMLLLRALRQAAAGA